MTAAAIYLLGCLLAAEFHAFTIDMLPEVIRGTNRRQRVVMHMTFTALWPFFAVALVLMGWFSGRAIRQAVRTAPTTQSVDSGTR